MYMLLACCTSPHCVCMCTSCNWEDWRIFQITYYTFKLRTTVIVKCHLCIESSLGSNCSTGRESLTFVFFFLCFFSSFSRQQTWCSIWNVWPQNLHTFSCWEMKAYLPRRTSSSTGRPYWTIRHSRSTSSGVVKYCPHSSSWHISKYRPNSRMLTWSAHISKSTQQQTGVDFSLKTTQNATGLSTNDQVLSQSSESPYSSKVSTPEDNFRVWTHKETS